MWLLGVILVLNVINLPLISSEDEVKEKYAKDVNKFQHSMERPTKRRPLNYPRLVHPYTTPQYELSQQVSDQQVPNLLDPYQQVPNQQNPDQQVFNPQQHVHDPQIPNQQDSYQQVPNQQNPDQQVFNPHQHVHDQQDSYQQVPNQQEPHKHSFNPNPVLYPQVPYQCSYQCNPCQCCIPPNCIVPCPSNNHFRPTNPPTFPPAKLPINSAPTYPPPPFPIPFPTPFKTIYPTPFGPKWQEKSIDGVESGDSKQTIKMTRDIGGPNTKADSESDETTRKTVLRMKNNKSKRTSFDNMDIYGIKNFGKQKKKTFVQLEIE